MDEYLFAHERKETGGDTGERRFAGIAQVIEYQGKYLPATKHAELWLSETRCQLQIIKLPYSTVYFAQSPGRDIGYVCDSGSLNVSYHCECCMHQHLMISENIRGV